MQQTFFVFTSILVLDACAGNQCDFFRRCNGNVVEQCGGIDQMFNRRVERYDCQQNERVCAEIDSSRATCVSAPATECHPAAFIDRCDDNTYVRCDDASRYVERGDCGDDANCVIGIGGVADCEARAIHR